ncbi:RagB/SusD family nutrient uptake outer membrane protein [Membranicola marinus]|uniref:RagB/SusD family nutrient uptake outer membrane protein n=1 Tax=Membranihabitans marinus TaxID=1227546 RepID=A0A953LCP4_9BACT|nr:RagB/SusD family nutrient uptake outer membrane protein [Membranihabitans marinus]MBY5958004.1 RagB/SusD family nutrient uptake outer membrane protein [Membranihabitans marinus]
MKHLSILFCTLIFLSGCKEDYLNVLPQDKITSASFWTSEDDVDLALNGIYSVLRHRGIYGAGPSLEACTPDAFQWAHWNGKLQQIGDGSATASTGEFIPERWTMCYRIIYRSNYLLENIDQVTLDADYKDRVLGETHFLRGIAYALLAETYGDVPIIDQVISAQEAREVAPSPRQEVWNKAIAEYDMAISSLKATAPAAGRATKGAALGMKMRAMLYQGKYEEVLDLVDQIDALDIYELFPSYEGLFMVENENNPEVIFDIQYIDGEQGQGNFFAWLGRPQGITTGADGASDVAPTQQMVDKYEMIDGSEVDPDNPYAGRDPRLDFSILRPGTLYEGLPYPGVIRNHTGQRVGFGMRKYTAEGVSVSSRRQVPLNFIVLRYGDVLMSKAEALIETDQNIPEAIALINRIRTERDDVKITALSTDLSQEEARKKLRKERRIEFFLEGTYWSDIKRWDIGSELYPSEVRAGDGSLIEIKFPAGYDAHYNLLPIPDDELSLNDNLTQNPGW